MHWTITLMLLLLWAMGLIGFSAHGPWMYLFLLVAIILFVINLLSRDRVR